MKKYSFLNFIGSLSLFASLNAAAQTNNIDPNAYGYYQDALRFSQTKFGGSARTLGVAGAVSALGADMGATAANPAGLGLYKKSEFAGSLGVGFAGSESNYNNLTLRDNKAAANIPQLGVVFANTIDPLVHSKWRGGAFAITLTRINNFQNRYSYDGNSPLLQQNGQYLNNSIMDYYNDLMGKYSASVLNINAENRNYEQDLLNSAYDSYIADVDTANNELYPIVPRGDLHQFGTVTTTGNQNQWDFAYGGNFDDRLYIGGSIGVATLSYQRESVYNETITKVANSSYNDFNGFTFQVTDNLKVSGTGINFKAGLIFRPTDFVRLGASIQSPTFYALNETSHTDMSANFNGLQYGSTTLYNESAKGTEFKYDYSLRTPMKATGGIAFILGKAGFLSFDAEYINYSNANLSVRSNSGNMAADNRTINKLYKSVINLRGGVELRYDVCRFRAGAAYYPDPYASTNTTSNLKRDQLFITGGFGIRMPNYYIDMAVVTNKFENSFQAHKYMDAISVKNNYTNVVFTVGTFF